MIVFSIKAENISVLRSKVIEAAKDLNAMVAAPKATPVTAPDVAKRARDAALEAPQAPAVKPPYTGKKRGRPPKAAAVVAPVADIVEDASEKDLEQVEPVPEVQPSPVEDIPEQAAEAAPVQLSELKVVLTQLIKDKGVAEVSTLLKEFGAEKLSEVKPEQYAAFHAKASQLVA